MLLARIPAARPLLEGPLAPGPDELDERPPALPRPREIYRWAIQRGWSQSEAGNWAAWTAGIPLADGEDVPAIAWTPAAVEHALFLRWLVRSGRLLEDS